MDSSQTKRGVQVKAQLLLVVSRRSSTSIRVLLFIWRLVRFYVGMRRINYSIR